MLTIYRRHRRSCKQRMKGRKHRHCQCPIWVTERHYAPWTRSRQEQIEADLRAAWSNDPLIKEVHAGYTARPAARTRVFSRRRIGRGGGDRTHDLRLKRPLLYH
jgi:hypothetical protein